MRKKKGEKRVTNKRERGDMIREFERKKTKRGAEPKKERHPIF